MKDVPLEPFVSTERLGSPHGFAVRMLGLSRLTDDHPTATCHLQVMQEENAFGGTNGKGLARVPGAPTWTDLHPELRCDKCSAVVGVQDEDRKGQYRFSLMKCAYRRVCPVPSSKRCLLWHARARMSTFLPVRSGSSHVRSQPKLGAVRLTVWTPSPRRRSRSTPCARTAFHPGTRTPWPNRRSTASPSSSTWRPNAQAPRPCRPLR